MFYAVSLLLIGLSGGLLDMHRRTWRSAQQDASLNERDVRFARAQYRRRCQASGIIGVFGAAIGVWPLVPVDPWAMAAYVAALAAACFGIVILAGLDMLATRQNLARLRAEQLTEQVKLLRELRQRTTQTHEH